MYAVIGPVLSKSNGYGFEVWTPETGARPSFSYPLVQEAHYARRSEMRRRGGRIGGVAAVLCGTIEEFAAEVSAASRDGG